VKVNGERVTDKLVKPGDVLSVAKHKYEVRYSPIDLGAVGPPPTDVSKAEIFSKSLLERAGLDQRQFSRAAAHVEPGEVVRFDVTNDDAGQLRFRNKPL
jgi:adenylate cyclase